MNKLSDLEQFNRLVRSRSQENNRSLEILMNSGNYAVAIGLLRQEIDTFVRVVYLNEVSEEEGMRLISDLVNAKQWRPKGKKGGRITDREMVNIAKKYYFWVEIAYNFGCKLIHLSNIHDYENIDPFLKIEEDDKNEIKSYLRSYHGYNYEDLDLNGFLEYLPNVMVKIHGKVDEYRIKLKNRFAT